MKGHHLQVCPTNMNPAYDKPPDDYYICIICMARGKHFKSLCPKNSDPHCLTQKRKAVGTPTKIAKVTNNETSRDRMQDAVALSVRLRPGESVDMEKENPKNLGKRERAESPRRDGTLVKRMRIEDPDAWIGDMVMSEAWVGGDVILRKTIEVQEVQRDPAKTFNANLQRLGQRYGESWSEVINPSRHRPTALDMWEQDDLKRFQHTDTWYDMNCIVINPHAHKNRSPDRSQSPSPESVLGARLEPGTMEEDKSCTSSEEEFYSPLESMSGRLTPYTEQMSA